ncbi:hypothetical protein AJ79_03004 [Helicocarpus griseus UAMH5409]|uniref:Uncharacterized protein n=1 Tax=Helicocarpus griseus UAMH5409 TaxID=1447875 RepID=A0A2B7Y0F6_9EURO|nr:hypothetical protein AJ79_03004 [Helicocarpus griseus UAMH5409]
MTSPSRPRNPTPDSGSPYEKAHPVLRSCTSHEMLSKLDTPSKLLQEDDIDTDSEPECNLYEDSKRGRSLSRSPSPAQLSKRTSANASRCPRVTEAGSPVSRSNQPENASDESSMMGSGMRRLRHHKPLKRRLFDLYSEADKDEGAEAAKNPATVTSQQQQACLLPLMEPTRDKAKYARNCQQQQYQQPIHPKDESNKENIPPPTASHWEGLGMGLASHPSRQRARHGPRRPLGLLNPSDLSGDECLVVQAFKSGFRGLSKE